MEKELKLTLKALFIPIAIVLIMVAIQLFTIYDYLSAHQFGILPLKVEGLAGIFLTVFMHQDWNHLISNAIPMLLFGWALFYFYSEFAFKSLILMWLLTGFWVWIFARSSYHIGASGLVYALASFHVLSAVLRKVYRLMAFAMLVVFLYGGMVWGFFPELFPERNISWESHLMGTIAGFMIAFYYRNEGIQRPLIFDEDEDENEYLFPEDESNLDYKD
jgi:membrane associated rhomboid family serine protease